MSNYGCSKEELKQVNSGSFVEIDCFSDRWLRSFQSGHGPLSVMYIPLDSDRVLPSVTEHFLYQSRRDLTSNIL